MEARHPDCRSPNHITPFGISLTISRCITSPKALTVQSQSGSCIVCGQQSLSTFIEAESFGLVFQGSASHQPLRPRFDESYWLLTLLPAQRRFAEAITFLCNCPIGQVRSSLLLAALIQSCTFRRMPLQSIPVACSEHPHLLQHLPKGTGASW